MSEIDILIQEWFQKQGDRFQVSAFELIQEILSRYPNIPLIVKEVGHGFGSKSLKTLMSLPLWGD